ncbi:hypothetical protein [Krasilnikovia sp. M28-CT-15]|uniref:hypothetical protein n=1 Tax=Krasilnikovia sp. M28-CT-15 TaxID=3373540 RepID=UPI00399C54DF
MEILPGEGVAMAKVGEARDVVESRLGPPLHPGRESRAVYATSPFLVLTYTDDELVELVELGYSGDGGEEVFFDGVQLTFRFMDDVVADLAAKGYRYEPVDIGYRFEPGFAIFSMGSRWARDLDPDASEDDPRQVCEGVSVASYDYLAGPTEEEIEAYIRGQEAEKDSGDSPEAAEIRRIIQETNERLAAKPESRA